MLWDWEIKIKITWFFWKIQAQIFLSHKHAGGKKARCSHTKHRSQRADPGETRLISLFSPDLYKESHALQMKGAALCSAALCASNKALIICLGTRSVRHRALFKILIDLHCRWCKNAAIISCRSTAEERSLCPNMNRNHEVRMFLEEKSECGSFHGWSVVEQCRQVERECENRPELSTRSYPLTQAAQHKWYNPLLSMFPNANKGLARHHVAHVPTLLSWITARSLRS